MTDGLSKLADRALLEAGIKRLPVRLEPVVRQVGARIFTYRDYARAAGISVSEVVKRYGPDGFTQRFGSALAVFYREAGNLRRTRWTVAHELGHILLGHLDQGTLGTGDADRQADALAAELLCPRTVLEACECRDSGTLAELCDISPTAARVVWKNRSMESREAQQERMLLAAFGEYIGERQSRTQDTLGEGGPPPRLSCRRL